jgi:hypothetical protein
MGEDLPKSHEIHQLIEGAAIRHDGHADTQGLSDEERDKALRARNPQPPLTDEDIAKLTTHRGKAPTQEEIDAMNRAREQGIHTSIV